MIMKKITRSIFLKFIPALVLIITSCEKESFKDHLSPVSEVAFQEKGSVGQEVNFLVKHIYTNGCGKFSRSETIENGKEVTVSFYAQYPANTVCPQNIVTVETVFRYTPKKTGEYIFKFNHGNGYIIDTLIVK